MGFSALMAAGGMNSITPSTWTNFRPPVSSASMSMMIPNQATAPMLSAVVGGQPTFRTNHSSIHSIPIPSSLSPVGVQPLGFSSNLVGPPHGAYMTTTNIPNMVSSMYLPAPREMLDPSARSRVPQYDADIANITQANFSHMTGIDEGVPRQILSAASGGVSTTAILPPPSNDLGMTWILWE